MRNVISLIETYLGEELTAQRAADLADGPIEHSEKLAAETLIPHYYDWLESESNDRAQDTKPIYHAIDPYPPEGDRASENRLKTLLLYFPHVALADPLSDVLWPAAAYAQLRGAFEGTPRFEMRQDAETRNRLRRALLFLAHVKPFVENGDVRLVPSTFALDYSSLQNAARTEVEAFERLTEEQRRHFPTEQIEHIGSVKVWGCLCAACDYTPIAGARWVDDVLRGEIKTQSGQSRSTDGQTTRLDLDTAAALSVSDLPGVSGTSLVDIARLRQNEEAFEEWRRDLRTIVAMVRASGDASDADFRRDFAQTAQDRLLERAEILKAKTKSSPALTKLLTPATLAIAGAALTAMYYPSSAPLIAGVPATAVASTSAGATGWLIDVMYTRFKKAGRRATLLRDFYGRFLEQIPS